MLIDTNELFGSSDKAHKKLKDSVAASTLNTLLANRIPVAVADKLSRQVANNIDFTALYEIIIQDIQDQHFPKQRVLDRTIVHMFEMLFRMINVKEQTKGDVKHKEFFTLVPRGECLDLFLQLVKEYCMGDHEIERYTHKIEPLIRKFSHDHVIDWETLYQSDEFKTYLDALLNLILTHFREDHKPIPALENKMPVHFQPYRINSFLNKIRHLQKTGSIKLDR